MSLFERYMKEKGLKSSTELDHMTSLYLVNDHPALSFPNLTLPNCLNIASLNYKTPKTLPLKIADFLIVCEKTFVALVKLGHTAHNSRLKETMGETILEALEEQDFCVMIQSKIPIVTKTKSLVS